MNPSDYKYTAEHEWINIEDDVATIGITEHATEELGEIVFCELPEVGDQFSQMEEFGSVESVKTVSSLFAPLSGEVVDVNTSLNDAPEQINESPFQDGWIIKISISDPKEVDDLMSANEYEIHLAEDE